mmetsp:Transcript_60890/g.170254  ORF Transcript_60890/g.170254 Transcript_60890/m.170254 type:complete len:244 (-) Transcript_60890:4-735(-)
MKDFASWNIEAYAAEFFGTFFVVLTVGFNTLQETALAPVSIGLVLTALCFSSGRISGAHFNPAVTLGVKLAGGFRRHSWDACAFALAQLSGGFLAGCTYCALLGDSFTFAPGRGYGLIDAMCVEALFTTALVLVVLGVSTQESVKCGGRQFGGLAVGFVVMAAGFAIGGISGCSLNPALAFGVMLSSWVHAGGSLEHAVPYIMTPILGALLAAGLFRILRGPAELASVPAPRGLESEALLPPI